MFPMSRTIAYHRPASIEDALDLLGSAGDRAAPRTILAGGTVVNATTGQEREVVDLQALGLDEIRLEGQSVSIGAMVPPPGSGRQWRCAARSSRCRQVRATEHDAHGCHRRRDRRGQMERERSTGCAAGTRSRGHYPDADRQHGRFAQLMVGPRAFRTHDRHRNHRRHRRCNRGRVHGKDNRRMFPSSLLLVGGLLPASLSP